MAERSTDASAVLRKNPTDQTSAMDRGDRARRGRPGAGSVSCLGAFAPRGGGTTSFRWQENSQGFTGGQAGAMAGVFC